MKFLIALLTIASLARAELPVRAICEERWKDDDLALFIPQRVYVPEFILPAVQ